MLSSLRVHLGLLLLGSSIGCVALAEGETTDSGEQSFAAPLDCTCGADVTDQIVEVVESLRTEFEAQSAEAQTDICSGFFEDTDQAQASSWDISAFYMAECRLTTTKGDCGADACGGSVSVDGGCYFAGHVNYALWGAGMRLCHEARPLDPRFMLPTVHAAVAAYRCKFYKCQGTEDRLRWTTVGWDLARGAGLHVPGGNAIFGGTSSPPIGGVCEEQLSDGEALSWSFGIEPTISGGTSWGEPAAYKADCEAFETGGQDVHGPQEALGEGGSRPEDEP